MVSSFYGTIQLFLNLFQRMTDENKLENFFFIPWMNNSLYVSRFSCLTILCRCICTLYIVDDYVPIGNVGWDRKRGEGEGGTSEWKQPSLFFLPGHLGGP